MKATTLEEVIRYFSRRPMTSQELDQWYVPRPSERDQVAVLLRTTRSPQKILFVGHRGSGKSTELQKLSEELADEFETVGFRIPEITGRTSPAYEDLMLAVSTQVTLYCIDHELIKEPIVEKARKPLQTILDWWHQVVAGQSFHTDPSGELTVQLKTILGQIELGVSESTNTRDAIREQINRQMPELIRYLNWVIKSAEAANKRLLIVVEDLDKIDPQSARSIFLEHAPTIIKPQASMIFTFPTALRYSDDFNEITVSFNSPFFLPNIFLQARDGTRNVAGLDVLRRIVFRRMEESLIEEEALKKLLHASGGIPNWLIRLVQSSALHAVVRDQHGGRIEQEDVVAAINKLSFDIEAPLTREDFDVLKARHADHILTNNSEERRLLFNGSLIEYAEGRQRWCDAHPVLWSLLE